MKLRHSLPIYFLASGATSSHLSVVRSIRRASPTWTALSPSEVILDVLKISPGYELDDPGAPPNTFLTDFITATAHRAVFGAMSEIDDREFTVSYTGSLDPTNYLLDKMQFEFDLLSTTLSRVEGVERPLLLSQIACDDLESGREVFSRFMVSEPVDELCINKMSSQHVPWDQRLAYIIDFAISGISTLRNIHTAGVVHGSLSRTSFAQTNQPRYDGEEIFTVLLDFSSACFLTNCTYTPHSPDDPKSLGLFALTHDEHRSKREDLFRFGEILYRMWNEEGYERAMESRLEGLDPTSLQYRQEIINFKKSFETCQVHWLAHEDAAVKAIDDFMAEVKTLEQGETPPYTYLMSLFSSARHSAFSDDSF